MSTTFEFSLISLCWCNNCSKLVTLETRPQHSSSSSSRCPNCNGGSIEKITREYLLPSLLSSAEHVQELIPNNPHIYFSNPHIYFSNPHIYIRRPTSNRNTQGGFDCYYDDGSGSGFTRLQSELLSTSEQIFHEGISEFGWFETNSLRRVNQPTTTSKAAIALIPTIEIQECHVSSNPHCAICLEPFDLETKAKEMPVCKHVYHSDCILSWLALHDSCPLCRHQLSSDDAVTNSSSTDEEDVDVGLVVWRLAGDMVALGRFSGAESLFQVMFKETPTSLISTDFRGNNHGDRERGRFRRVFKSLFSCFNGGGRAFTGSYNHSLSLHIFIHGTMGL